MTTQPHHPSAAKPLLCLLAALSASTLQAQTAPAPTGATEKKEEVLKLEAISVTGTNIKRLDQEKVLPVTIFSQEAMDVRQAITPVELLTALPQVTNVPLNESTAGGANSRGDNANVNLRGIGSGNTLVLLNGRRLAPNPMTSPDAGQLAFSVNVNQLPTQGIDHIDILRDGASSIYGSDAVAGVINYISRKDFRGTELRTRASVPEHGGGRSLQTTATYGVEFAKGAGHWLTTVDALWRDPIFMNQRDFTRYADHSSLAPAPFNVVGSAFDGRATVGNYPTFRVGAATTATVFRPVNGTPTITTTAATRAANPEFYLNINDYQNLGQSKSDRQNWFNNLEYEISDRITAFADLSFYHSNTNLIRQPVFINAPGSDLLKPIAIDNPYNPYGSRFFSPTGAPNADGTPRLTGTPQQITLLAVSFNDAGGENVVVHSGVYRAVAGLRGKLGGDWTWETGALYTRAYASDISRTAIRESALAASLLRTDANAFNPFGYTFKVQAGSALPVADKPYVNPKSALDLIVQTWRREGFSAITGYDLRTAGPVFRYWGNTVSVAAGGELRREQFMDKRAPFVGVNGVGNSLGLNPDDNDFVLASPKPDSSGNRTIYSGYAELILPVIGAKHNIPLVNSLEFTSSARYENYSDFGTTTRPKVGMNWKPYQGLMVRASFNEGFTAPNLPTLYAPSQFTVDSAPGNLDPYRNAAIGEGQYSMRNYSAGNTKLQPTTSIGKSLGVVLEVPKVKGLSVTADYWQIDQSNVIGSRSANQILASDQNILNAYVASQIAAGKTASQIDLGSGTANYKGDPAIARFVPSATDIAAFNAANASKPASQQLPVVGQVLSRTANYENIAKGYASGVDLSLNYQLPVLPVGRISLNTEWSYLIRSYQFRALAGSPSLFTERLDVDGTTRWRGVGTVSWRKGPWGAGFSGYYTGSYADSSATTTAAVYNTLGTPKYLSRQFTDGNYAYRYRVHDVVSFNSYVSYRFNAQAAKWLRESSIRLGVVNLTDKEPPLVSGAFGYSAGVHGSLFAGRTWSLELTKRF
ncbi:MAG: TonB-dependent receptor [Verrucomicrobia bacterium]|nr:TonB-dependent receptor [Verrucomicrobiota bacterium]